MKTKFTNREIFHVWAQRPWGNGGTAYGEGSNVFFEREKIYSYGHHYKLAEFLDFNTVLINDKGYSNTTAKHISQVTSATTHKRQFFETRTDVDRVVGSVKNCLEKLAKARKPEKYIDEITEILSHFFRFHESPFSNVDKRTSEYRFLKRVKDNGPESFVPDVKRDIERAKRELELRAKRRAEAYAQKVRDFLTYEKRYVEENGFPDVIRLSKDGQSVETGRGVTVSRSAASTLYRLILAGKNVRGHNIEGYTVTAFNGALKIGCHNIDMAHVHRVGEQIINN